MIKPKFSFPLVSFYLPYIEMCFDSWRSAAQNKNVFENTRASNWSPAHVPFLPPITRCVLKYCTITRSTLNKFSTSTVIPAEYSLNSRREYSIWLRNSTILKLKWIGIRRGIHIIRFTRPFRSEECGILTTMWRFTTVIEDEEVNEKCSFRAFYAILTLQCSEVSTSNIRMPSFFY